MGTKVRFAVWRREGRRFVVRPPDWPRDVEYSCTDQEMLIKWAQAHKYMLKDGNTTKRGARA